MILGRYPIRILIIISLLTLVGSSCGEGGCSGLFGGGSGKGVPVMVERVKVKEVSPVVTVIGKLVPSDKAEISYPNDVKVQEVYVSVGDFVLAGDPLFRLAEEDMTNELNLARTRGTELEAIIDKNRNLLNSRERLLEEGKVDQDEINRLEKTIAADEAELERVKAQIVKLSSNLEDVVVNSPISGMIIERNINAGGTAKAKETLFRIVNINPINVSFPIDAKQSQDINIGTPLNIYINDLPDEKFTAKVTYINPELHRGNTFEVWALIPNDELILKSGMRASTEFVSDTLKHSYLIPESAVISKPSRPFVYKVEKGVAHKTPITIGSISGGQIEVMRGLERGDIVVVKGAEDLYDGAEVSIWRR